MIKFVIITLSFLTILHAVEIPKIKIKDLKRYPKYELVEITAIVFQKTQDYKLQLFDCTGEVLCHFENTSRSKQKDIIENFTIGDTLIIQGENRPSIKSAEKVIPYRIVHKNKTIYRRYSPPTSHICNELESIIIAQQLKTTTTLRGLRVSGRILTSVGSVSLLTGILLISGSNWDGLFSGAYLIGQSTTLILPGLIFLGNTGDQKRKLKALNKFVKPKTFNLQIKPVKSGGGLFFTGKF